MKFFGKIWKVLLALALLIAAFFFYKSNYVEKRIAYEPETARIETYIKAMQASIAENQRYASVQEKLEPAAAAVEASRLKLYQNFPRQIKEEDQIMYVLYLETLFGTEIFFDYGQLQAVAQLSDGAILMKLLLTVNYETTYDGFKDMVNYLSTDSRITSVESANINYNAEKDEVSGNLTLSLYVLESELLEYQSPDVAEPETGKENIFD